MMGWRASLNSRVWWVEMGLCDEIVNFHPQ
jgi:hypothetical protein